MPEGYKLIEPVKGDPSFSLDYIRRLLPGIQADYFLTWLYDRIYALQHPEKYRPGQGLIIGGERRGRKNAT